MSTKEPVQSPNWITNLGLLWRHRRALVRTASAALVLSLATAFLLPKHYESSARILPPGNSMGGAALLAALAGRSGGWSGLSALAGGMMSGSGNTSLFIDLLRSGTISGHLMDRFDLQHVYHKRYRVDTAKFLARRTAIVDDKKSGVITLTVTDNDPVRARDIAQAYLDELNLLVNRTNTSSAHQERVFIEKRLQGVQEDLARAQQKLSDFSSTHATVDIKEQTRALVDASSRIESQLIVEQSGLDSLRQMYGDENVRVRSAQARIAVLRSEIAKMGGSSKTIPFDQTERAAVSDGNSTNGREQLYPALRELPRLAVPYADLYREVRVQENVYELLTQQYEIARIQEVKDTPVVSVIDVPGIPEKKSFPPRLLLALGLTVCAIATHALIILTRMRWSQVRVDDPRRILASDIAQGLRESMGKLRFWLPALRGAR